MSKFIQILCPSCGNTIKSESIHGSIVYCKGCHSYKILSGSSNILQPAFYKIYHHPAQSLDTNKQLYDFFANIGDPKIFDKLEIIHPVRRYYLPVREISDNGKRIFVCLNEIDSQFLEPVIKDGTIDSATANRIMDRRSETDLISTDYKPIYLPKPEDKTTFLQVNVNLNKLDAIYGVDHNEITIVKYLPISILETNMGTVISSGSTILNREQIIATVNESIDTQTKSRKKFRDILSDVVRISIGVFLLLSIYKALTIELSFTETLLNVASWFLFGIWAVVWLGLYFIGISILFAPIILMVFFAKNMLDSQKVVSDKKTNMKKGKQIFNLG